MTQPARLAEQPSLSGVARVDRRTKALIARLQPGDIAVIDHEDLDRVAAETLVGARPAAVINASSSIPAGTRTSVRWPSPRPASR